MKLVLGIVFYAGCAFAQSGIEVPAIGAIVDSTGALRPVQGVAGNFWLGPAKVPGVLSAACSGRLCLVKTDSKILSPSGETDAPPGPAIFDIEGDEALLFFPQQHKFARWHADTLDALDWAVDGEVLAVLLRGREPEIAVRRDGQVWIVRPDDSALDSIAGAAGPVLLLPDGVLFATSDGVVLRNRNATDVRFELTGVEAIGAMGFHYAAIHVGHVGNVGGPGDAIYALRTDPGREGLFLLPGSVP
jgi:hypothetical protein